MSGTQGDVGNAGRCRERMLTCAQLNTCASREHAHVNICATTTSERSPHNVFQILQPMHNAWLRTQHLTRI
eukprot:5349870-Pyramimonas_sp.AAC.1